ncbi:MAG: hypothetical protein CO071_02190 [Gallionellales bacterium CG_4_9_14_0_8_um_filter_59_50]|nr:MAG: hypothetical protein COT19_04250 [Gallionellales bacterium CG08_land_8_20_14_0_20_59_87]PJC02617.1 MAG: hypothetical protein CO071_02190 [Gallionellales bacterium CG_4_9_14_0_8_um_filter_59_50]
MNDIVINKAEIIERALSRVRDTYARHRDDLEQSFDAQDVILLNLQRACEAAIDLAMHIVRVRALGLPKDSKTAFDLLHQAGEISPELADKLKKMTGFRNIAVHDYRALDWRIVRSLIEKGVQDLKAFAETMVKQHG